MSTPNLLMIPGPIGLSPDVLRALSEPQRGHLDPVFMQRFHITIKRLLYFFLAPTSQPFLITFSRTLSM